MQKDAPQGAFLLSWLHNIKLFVQSHFLTYFDKAFYDKINIFFCMTCTYLSTDSCFSLRYNRIRKMCIRDRSFTSFLSGDDSLNSRPMGRIIRPLSMMGARIESLSGNDCAPLMIQGQPCLHGIRYESPVASAQVKSAILLAGLYADSPTTILEPSLSRNHTELMLSQFGAVLHTTLLESGEAESTISPCDELYAQDIFVPGDISSAAYFIGAALLVLSLIHI